MDHLTQPDERAARPLADSPDATALAAVGEAARAIARVLGIGEGLQLIVDRVRDLLHAQAGRLAVADERDRIGRDLHDGIIQSLYAVSLSLEDVPELMVDARPEAARRVDEAINSLHLAIRDIRNFIYGLRPEAVDGR